MKAKGIALVAAFILAAALVLTGTPGNVAAAPAVSLLSVKPKITLNPNIQLAVNIPDPALRSALHAATGVPSGDAIFPSDLNGLIGTLNLTDRGIADGEGLQYCINITELKLNQNNLSRLPDNFHKLTKLKKINLDENKFAVFPPSLLQMPGLTDVLISDNKLESLPDTIDSIANLQTFHAMHNKIADIPVSMYKCTKLRILFLSGNGIKKLPKELFKAPSLEYLRLGKNRITDIPAEVKTAPKLKGLYLEYNMLTKLPSGIGSAPVLQSLELTCNSLSSVEQSLYEGNVQYLSLAGNRLKMLPVQMQGKQYKALYLEWNYLDVSPGSESRAILNSIDVTDDFSYMNQLSPVNIVSTSSTTNSVKLSWKPLADGTAGATKWKVLKFEVYDAGQSPAKLLDTLDESADNCTITGLTAGKEYSLFVRVLYELEYEGTKNNTSSDTAVKASTKAGQAAATVAPTDQPQPATGAPTASNTPEAIQSGEATAAPTPASETTTADAEATPTATDAEPSTEPGSAKPADGNSGLMIALIAVGSVIALAIIVLIIVLLTRKQTIRIRK